MNVLIIEDEEMAANRLAKMLYQLESDIIIIGQTESISQSINWFGENPMPELIFADINLADGESFEIFKKINITCPIIFTTAYDQYAVQAFKFNSIDYLLKPIKAAELKDSLEKYRNFIHKNALPDYSKLIETLSAPLKNFQKRMLVKTGQKIQTVEIIDLSYIYTEEKITFAYKNDGKKIVLDQSLDELEKILNPNLFFRINRQFIINIEAIDTMHTYSKSRVKVELKPPTASDTIVSAERSASFKEWLLGRESY